MIRLFSRISGTAEERIREELDQIVEWVGDGSRVLFTAIVLQMIVIGYFLLVWSLAQ